MPATRDLTCLLPRTRSLPSSINLQPRLDNKTSVRTRPEAAAELHAVAERNPRCQEQVREVRSRMVWGNPPLSPLSRVQVLVLQPWWVWPCLDLATAARRLVAVTFLNRCRELKTPTLRRSSLFLPLSQNTVSDPRAAKSDSVPTSTAAEAAGHFGTRSGRVKAFPPRASPKSKAKIRSLSPNSRFPRKPFPPSSLPPTTQPRFNNSISRRPLRGCADLRPATLPSPSRVCGPSQVCNAFSCFNLFVRRYHSYMWPFLGTSVFPNTVALVRSHRGSKHGHKATPGNWSGPIVDSTWTVRPDVVRAA